MQCILFEDAMDSENKICLAVIDQNYWHVDEDAITKFCKTDAFLNCPRYIAYEKLKR